MVNKIRKALGFMLMPGGNRQPVPEVPHQPEQIVVRASALRGYSDKDAQLRFIMLTGQDESAVLRNLRAVVVEREKPPAKACNPEGLNLVIFRGVFGSGGYGLKVTEVAWQDGTLVVDCDFEDPGAGIRTTAGFTQPAALVPLKALPPGKYHASLRVRRLRRSSEGVVCEAPAAEIGTLSFKVSA